MNPPQSAVRYFVRVGREVRGPYDVAQLRQLGDVQVITPATEAALASSGPWFKLESVAECAAIFPPRAELALTEAKFETTPDSPEPLDLREIIAYSNTLERVLRPSHPPDLAAHHAAKAAADPNDVESMVRGVQAIEAQFAPPPPPPPKWRPSRRLVLIASLAFLGNTMLAAILTFYEGWRHEFSLMISAGIAVIYNGGLLIAYRTLPKE